MHLPRNPRESGAKAPLSCGRTEKWRLLPCVLAGTPVFLFFCIALAVRRGIQWQLAILFVRLGILTAASVSDLRTRRVSNFYSLAMWITGFHKPEGVRSLLWRAAGMLAVFFVLYVVYRLFPQKTMGGADIKMLSALTFVLGWGIIPVLVYLLGFCVLLLLVLLVWRKKEALTTRIPFFPLMTLALWLYYFI